MVALIITCVLLIIYIAFAEHQIKQWKKRYCDATSIKVGAPDDK